MTGVSMICQYPTNLVSVMPPSLKPISNTFMLTSNFVRFPAKPKARFAGGVRNKFSFPLRAAVDVDFEIEKSDSEEPTTEIGLLKKQLVDLFYGTNYGINASSETRAEILELITQLEVLNPTPEPTEALSLLNGKWILAYTSFASLYHLPSSETLPLVKVKEISQTIDSENFTVQNSVVFSGPGSTTAISAIATFEIRSPKLVQLKFDEGIIGTPQLTDSIPESIEVFGHVVDLSSFKGWVTSIEETISSQPPFKFSLAKTNVESWLLTTYLDEELRISRGDGGKVYVLFPEGSSYLSP